MRNNSCESLISSSHRSLLYSQNEYRRPDCSLWYSVQFGALLTRLGNKDLASLTKWSTYLDTTITWQKKLPQLIQMLDIYTYPNHPRHSRLDSIWQVASSVGMLARTCEFKASQPQLSEGLGGAMLHRLHTMLLVTVTCKKYVMVPPTDHELEGIILSSLRWLKLF